ncbi:hypothetical protein CMK11_15975 [Candidatus Poribacteria bacterium]|nr:hypothetical protein [Candidatus Poribacteria bacterium]
MLHRLQLTLRRRQRILKIRERQQEHAEQALAVYLREEEELRQERDGYLDAAVRTRSAMLGAFDGDGTVSSDVFVTYVKTGESLGRLADGKATEIEALQPTIQVRREDVLEKYKTKRAMEILTSKTGERVEEEGRRAEQRTLDELTSQRYRGPNGSGDEPQ